MRNVTVALLTLLVVFFAACQKEQTVAPEVPETVAENPAELELPPLTDNVTENLQMLYDEAGIEKDLSTSRFSIQPVAPGSTTGDLQAAINAAGAGGIVVLLPGMHIENNGININQPVVILGMPGSVLKTGTTVQPTNLLDAFFHINNAPGTILAGVNMVATSSSGGGNAILVENSDRTYLSRCNIREYQFSVIIEQSDLVKVRGNQIDAYSFQNGGLTLTYGVVVVNGKRAIVTHNRITDSFFGIWACDVGGTLFRNICNANYHGIILCKVPTPGLVLPSGQGIGSQVPCTRWQVKSNVTNNNFDVGIIVIDGATQNRLMNNRLSGNGFFPFLTGGPTASPLGYQMELTDDTYRFGFLSPKSSNNTVFISNPAITYKDCGMNNNITGGTLVPNTASSPCR